MSGKMRNAVLEEDWGTVALNAAQVAQKFMAVQVPLHHRLGTPWVGAWERLVDQSS